MQQFRTTSTLILTTTCISFILAIIMSLFFFLIAAPIYALTLTTATPRNATTFCPPLLFSLAHTKLPGTAPFAAATS
jgi:hypothetical protein